MHAESRVKHQIVHKVQPYTVSTINSIEILTKPKQNGNDFAGGILICRLYYLGYLSTALVQAVPLAPMCFRC